MTATSGLNVLVVAHHDAFGRQMSRWAIGLHRQGSSKPIVYITEGFIARHMAACEAAGIPVLSRVRAGDSRARPSPQPDASPRGARRALRRIPALHRAVRSVLRAIASFAALLSIPRQVAALRRDVAEIRRLIRDRKISAVLIAETGPDYGAAACVRACRAEGVPLISCPIEQSTAHHYAEIYLSARHLRVSRPLNRLIAALYPRWVLAHRNQQLLRTERTLLLSLELAGLAPPHPWQLIGNGEAAVAVDSQATFYHYVAEGVESARMSVVGRAEHDIMSLGARNRAPRRVELCRRLGLDPAKPILLSPVVQGHYVTGRPECDFQDYDQMVEFWVRSISKNASWNVVLNLHPGHTLLRDASSWKYLESWGARLCTDDLPELIPLCDLYVAAGSTTIQWAIACGRPVIDYDVYRYGVTAALYRSALGVLSTQEQAGFVALLHDLTSRPDYLAEITARQCHSAEQWGQLDGQASARLVALMRRLRAEMGESTSAAVN